MPLLHTWSLAVEEQFYVVWPLVFQWLPNPSQAPYPYTLAVVGLGLFSLTYASFVRKPPYSPPLSLLFFASEVCGLVSAIIRLKAR